MADEALVLNYDVDDIDVEDLNGWTPLQTGILIKKKNKIIFFHSLTIVKHAILVIWMKLKNCVILVQVLK